MVHVKVLDAGEINWCKDLDGSKKGSNIQQKGLLGASSQQIDSP